MVSPGPLNSILCVIRAKANKEKKSFHTYLEKINVQVRKNGDKSFGHIVLCRACNE